MFGWTQQKRYSTYLFKRSDIMNIMHWIAKFSLLLVLSTKCICQEIVSQKSPPHIIFILADDMGWNDVSFHGSPEVPTPNIDALGLSGITLRNYYTEALCTPSRGSLMTGLYPIRLGLQHRVIFAGERSALPLNLTILPQHLQKLGYQTHMIGKWHLGYHLKDYMPTQRGFTTFIGYMNGVIDYYDYTNVKDGFPTEPTEQVFFGTDLFNGTQPIRRQGHYATHFFAETARDTILTHDTTKPLFLYLPHLAVHASAVSHRVQAPPETVRKFKYINDKNRRIYAAITSVLDDAVGMVIEALHQKSMLDNSIVLFLSDNGAPVKSEEGGFGTNYPLRGHKATLWEGGIRVPGLIWSPLFNLLQPRISQDLIHVSDWLPTLYRAAGGDPKELGLIDGHDVWEVFTNQSLSPRTDILHNIDPIFAFSSYRKGDLKLVNGSRQNSFNLWHGPSGLDHVRPESMERWVFQNGSTVRDILKEKRLWIAQDVDDWYRQNQVSCQQPPPESAFKCDVSKKPCLFNIKQDPCEYNDLADEHPQAVQSMLDVIQDYQKVAVPPQHKPLDPLADPACHHFAFVPWLEPEYFNECDYLS